MKLFYCDHFVLPLPEGHRFPMQKYALLRERVVEAGIAAADDLHVPPPVTDREIERVHATGYVRRVVSGGLTREEIRRIGFPWSPQLVERSRRSAGGTVAACRAALEDGASVNLAGGTHHASRARGEGFCVFNDSAIAARAMQAAGCVERVVVLDCDVHQGNGTADIFADDPTVFTLSVHAARNFPFRKTCSDLDIGLPDGAEDDEYLAAVRKGLGIALEAGRPDLVIYVSGADPFVGDRLGRLNVSPAGLAERDHLVCDTLAEAGVPVAAVMAGGYATDVDATVAIHLETVRAVSRVTTAVLARTGLKTAVARGHSVPLASVAMQE
ncbi:MAG: histone deacetylase [Gammaproteobacteria bacterium]|nr:histone deacetylase [Gammaproteobacteria bacterium]